MIIAPLSVILPKYKRVFFDKHANRVYIRLRFVYSCAGTYKIYVKPFIYITNR